MKFKKIGGKIKLSWIKEAFGDVVVSDEAFFLMPRQRNNAAVGSAVQAAGELFHDAAAKSITKTESVYKVSRSDVETDLSHPEWPVDRVGDVLFLVPKSECTSFKYSPYSGITIKAGDETFKVGPTNLFFPRGTRQFLSDAGWIGIGK